MRVKVPELKRCCCCIPLRAGIIIFGYINILFSVLAIACLVVMTEIRKASLTKDEHLEAIMSTLLFSIFGMSVFLNVLLLIAGFQRDEHMLRLYTYYTLGTTLAAVVPTIILLSRLQYIDVCAAFLAIAMQCYLIVLVRSEVLKLEREKLNVAARQRCYEEIIAVPDNETLL